MHFETAGLGSVYSHWRKGGPEFRDLVLKQRDSLSSQPAMTVQNSRTDDVLVEIRDLLKDMLETMSNKN